MNDYDQSPFTGHVCNALCQPGRGIHAVLTYSTNPKRTIVDWQAKPNEGFEVLEAHRAPEAPTLADYLTQCPEFQELLDVSGITPAHQAIINTRGYAYLVIVRDTDAQGAA